MAKQRQKQFDQSKTGSSKLGFDKVDESWVFVKKQRVFIVLPSLPLPEQCTVEKPEISHSEAELRDFVADSPEAIHVHTLVPSLPLPEHFGIQKPATLRSQDMLRDGILDTHRSTYVHNVVPSLPVTERYTLHNPAASRSQAVLRDCIVNTQETTPLHTVAPSLPLPQHFSLQKSTTSHSQAELRADMDETTLVHTMVPSLPVPTLQRPATSQSQAELRSETREATLLQTVVPSLPVTDLRDFVSDTHETNVEPESCPDFTAVDKPEIVTSSNHTTRKAPDPRRSAQYRRMDQNRRQEGIRRSHTGRKPIRFPRVMCRSVVMDNEKLRVLNLEKKVEKAGGLNEWVGSIGLGREFERMLRGQRMSKFQVANLTMEKLKQMGALAVGPRRKLIHAIQCVYHPHCLRASII
ncbi:unnamed protein product [Cochlearia groenlandica]